MCCTRSHVRVIITRLTRSLTCERPRMMTSPCPLSRACSNARYSATTLSHRSGHDNIILVQASRTVCRRRSRRTPRGIECARVRVPSVRTRQQQPTCARVMPGECSPLHSPARRDRHRRCRCRAWCASCLSQSDRTRSRWRAHHETLNACARVQRRTQSTHTPASTSGRAVLRYTSALLARSTCNTSIASRTLVARAHAPPNDSSNVNACSSMY
jgi:hypothetical protein